MYELVGSKVGNDKMGCFDELDISIGSNMFVFFLYSCSDELFLLLFVLIIGISWDFEGRLVLEMVLFFNFYSY